MFSIMDLQGNVRAWGNLLRVPNLLTVPGDVLVGFVLVLPNHHGDAQALLVALLASLALYAAGLIMNDLVDCEIDRRERPARPICSGAVSRKAARNLMALFMAGALVMLATRGVVPLASGIAVGALIFFYNLFARRNRVLAALVMGLCRAGNVVLGAAAVSGGLVFATQSLVVPFWWLAYIGAVSWIAAREVRPVPYGVERWLPAAVVVAGAAASVFLLHPFLAEGATRGIVCFVFALLLSWQAGVRLGVPVIKELASGKRMMLDVAKVYPVAIGWLISALIPLQAGLLVLLSNEAWVLLAALLLLFCWPLNRWLAKMFSAS